MTLPERHSKSDSMASTASFVVKTIPPSEDVVSAESIDGVNSTPPPLVQPAASRLISCLRAPCLKRSSAGSTGASPSLSPCSELSKSPEAGNSAASSGDEAVAIAGSFAAIKRVLGAKPCARQVHFDAEPPQAGITHSGDQYDRRPIECTRKGEENDLSLPPRGTCQSYTGDADDEAGAADDDEEDDTSRAERIRGFARWSRLKNHFGAVRGASLRASSALTASTASADSGTVSNVQGNPRDLSAKAMIPVDEQGSPSLESDDEIAQVAQEPALDGEDDRNSCSQPFHGVRSFGRISNRPDEPHMHASKGYDERVLTLSQTREDKAVSIEEEEDPEHEAFKQAVYAALSLSPNATPMPSPNVRPRWESVTSYFDTEGEAGVGSGKSSGSTTPGPGITFVDDSGNADVIKADIGGDAILTASEGLETISVADRSMQGPRTKLHNPLILNLSRDTPSPSIESSTIASSSPLSSRSSSEGTFSSPSETAGKEVAESNAFDSAFGMHDMPSFAVTGSVLISGNELSRSALEPSQICQHSSSEDSELHSCSSSNTSAGTFGNTTLGSCSTSPDLSSNELSLGERACCKSTPTLTPTLAGKELTHSSEKAGPSSSDAKQVLRDRGTGSTFSQPSIYLSSYLEVPANLHAHRSISSSGEQSPCVHSADECDLGKSSGQATSASVNNQTRGHPMLSMLGSDMLLRRTNSSSGSTRKTRRNPRRVISTMCAAEQEVADSDSAAGDMMNPLQGNRRASEKQPRPPRCASRPHGTLGQRSKSMSSASPSTLKRSSFACSTFRSEIDDDGALGGF